MSKEDFRELCDMAKKSKTRDNGAWVALMWASINGNVPVFTLLLERVTNVHARSDFIWDALMFASSRGKLEVCLLLITREAFLMQARDIRTALDQYGEKASSPRYTRNKKEQSRAILRAAFDKHLRWALRWPMMSVMTGCGFRPLAVRLQEREMQPPPALIALDTPEHRRAFYMRLIFLSDFLLRRIVMFL